MKEIMENIKNFFKGIAKALRRFMGQDIPDAELLENDNYAYRQAFGFNELSIEDQNILYNAKNEIEVEEKRLSMQEALKMAKKSKLKSNMKAENKAEINKAMEVKKPSKEQINVDRDL